MILNDLIYSGDSQVADLTPYDSGASSVRDFVSKCGQTMLCVLGGQRVRLPLNYTSSFPTFRHGFER